MLTLPEGKPPFSIIFLWFSYGFPMVSQLGFAPPLGCPPPCLEIRGPTSVSEALPGPTRSFPAASAIFGIHLDQAMAAMAMAMESNYGITMDIDIYLI